MSDQNQIPQENENESVQPHLEENNPINTLGESEPTANADLEQEEPNVKKEELEEVPSDVSENADEATDITHSEAVESSPETGATPISASDEEDINDEEEISSSEDEEEVDEDDVSGSSADYQSMNQKELIDALKNLLATQKIQNIKKEVEEIRSEFNSSFEEEYNEKKEEFIAAGGNFIDFHYTTKLKSEFDSLYFDYKVRRNNYYKELKKDLQLNLQKRLDLIEELKSLITVEEDLTTTFKRFREIQNKWREAGAIPRDRYNLVWNNYHHHVEIFYDFVHLNKEFRDMDFKHNLEEKMKIISRAEALAQEPDIKKAFRELQMLHKMWKEETGPIEKDLRQQVWDRFSAATKVIHDRRADYLKNIESSYEENLETKKALIEKIKQLAEQENNHTEWQQHIKTVESLRTDFFKAGKVPQKDTEAIWNEFKEAVRTFNRNKNKFYKQQKKEQFDNLRKKRELIQIAIEHKDSTDFETVTPLMKKIQEEWKTIGHVPRRESDKIWKEFKDACNQYFDRLYEERNKFKKEEEKALAEKVTLLEEVQQLNESADTPELDKIKEFIRKWKEIGRVPYARKSIENKFNRLIDSLFKKLDISKMESELLKYENKLNILASGDERKVQNEAYFISKKIEEIKQSINQQENNLGFFQHVDQNNPMVREVLRSIEKMKDELEMLQAKYAKLKEHL